MIIPIIHSSTLSNNTNHSSSCCPPVDQLTPLADKRAYNDEDVRAPSPASSLDSSSDLESFTIPDEETRQKILSVVEFLFSDENLIKDTFLLKHVRRNKEGFVSLKLISSLRKVKSICKKWKQVSYTIDKYSKTLVINEDGSKVRRINRLPQSIESKSNKSTLLVDRQILLTNISSDQFNASSLSQLLTPHGSITSIQLYACIDESPHLAPWTNVLTAARVNKSVSCALVQFESSCGAFAALLALQALAKMNWRFTLQSFSLKHAKGSGNKQENITRRRANTYAHENTRCAPVAYDSRKKSDSCSSLVCSMSRRSDVTTIRQPVGPNGSQRGFRSDVVTN